MSFPWRTFGLALIASLVIAGLVRADLKRFQARKEAIRQSCQKERQAPGIPDGDTVRKIYPTPEIRLLSGECIPPGGTAEIVIQGLFLPNTKFVFENDRLEVLRESLNGNTYRATLKAASGVGPISAGVWAASPVSGAIAQRDSAVFVGGNYEFDLKTQNGWPILARTTEDLRCRSRDHLGENLYEVLFFRRAESDPFEKRKASLRYSLHEEMPFRLSIDQSDQVLSQGVSGMQELMKKLGDPNLSDS